MPNIKPGFDFKVSDEGVLHFKCEGGAVGAEREYGLDLTLFGGVDSSASGVNVTARHAVFKIAKKESGPYWDRLLKEAGKNVHMAVDWDHWKDEDEEDDFAFGSQFNDNYNDNGDLMDFGARDSDDDSDDDVGGAAEGV